MGWHCRYGPSVNTRRLLMEHGGFFYDSDYYGDELPFWRTLDGQPHLISLLADKQRWKDGGVDRHRGRLVRLIRNAFYMSYEKRDPSKMMSVGLHNQ